MRLLKRSTMQFEEFPDISAAPPYAILSHTWGKKEVSFQDFQNDRAREMDGYTKIIGCCKQTVLDGLEFVWIDTCCIDKTSSSELSEAINSMYLWYESAYICYAYLADVSGSMDHQTWSVEFAQSRWFTRGWTLQELLAPSKLVFFDRHWQTIGTKAEMQTQISHITGIPDHILDAGSEDPVSPSPLAPSIAMRMSWASKRQTTRIEDMAYCLMGIFGVNMPLLYGEGRNAFTRLQHEILRSSDDHSIFAWRSDVPGKETGLLARSPTDFTFASAVCSNQHFTQDSPYSITNFGLHIQLPLKPLIPDRTFLASLNCSLVGRECYLQIYVLKKTATHFVRIWPSIFEVFDYPSPHRPVPMLQYIYVKENDFPNFGGRNKYLDLHEGTRNTIRSSYFLTTLPSREHGFVLKAVYPNDWTDELEEGGRLDIGTAKILIFQRETEESFAIVLGCNHTHDLWCDFPKFIDGKLYRSKGLKESFLRQLHHSYKLEGKTRSKSFFQLDSESSIDMKGGNTCRGQLPSITIRRSTYLSEHIFGYIQKRRYCIGIDIHGNKIPSPKAPLRQRQPHFVYSVNLVSTGNYEVVGFDPPYAWDIHMDPYQLSFTSDGDSGGIRLRQSPWTQETGRSEVVMTLRQQGHDIYVAFTRAQEGQGPSADRKIEDLYCLPDLRWESICIVAIVEIVAGFPSISHLYETPKPNYMAKQLKFGVKFGVQALMPTSSWHLCGF